jgi:hypothetical protein
MLSLNTDLLNELAAFMTAFAALFAMWAVGHQDWRTETDAWARRVCLGVLAAVAMTHALSPDKLPEVAQQFVLCALLIIIAIGSSPRTDRPWESYPKIGAGKN